MFMIPCSQFMYSPLSIFNTRIMFFPSEPGVSLNNWYIFRFWSLPGSSSQGCGSGSGGFSRIGSRSCFFLGDQIRFFNGRSDPGPGHLHVKEKSWRWFFFSWKICRIRTRFLLTPGSFFSFIKVGPGHLHPDTPPCRDLSLKYIHYIYFYFIRKKLKVKSLGPKLGRIRGLFFEGQIRIFSKRSAPDPGQHHPAPQPWQQQIVWTLQDWRMEKAAIIVNKPPSHATRSPRIYQILVLKEKKRSQGIFQLVL